MKKIGLGLVLSFCLVFPCGLIMSACDDGVADCAYIRFVPSDQENEIVEYTDSMYDNSHIYLLPKDYDRNNTAIGGSSLENEYILKITFKQNYGKDDSIDGKTALCINIEDWYSMRISIKSTYWAENKKVYLNGEDITSKADTTSSKAPEEVSTSLGPIWVDGVYYFEDFGLVKGNSSEFINTIEYK